MSFNKQKIKDAFFSSAIIRFSKRCYDDMLSGFFGSHLTDYTENQSRFEKGRLGGKSDDVGDWRQGYVSRFRRRAIVSYENSTLLGALSMARDWLIGCHMKFYGFFFVYFGMCIMLMELLQNFANMSAVSLGPDMVLGIVIAVLAFPMLLSGKTLALALRESFLFSKLFFDFMGFSETGLRKYDSRYYGAKRYFGAAAAGALLGCLSYFIAPVYIVFASAAFICAVMVYKSPEVGVLLTVFSAPFLSFIGAPSMLLAALVIYTFMCMVVKVFLGKLVLKFEFSDVFVFLFMLVMLFGGVASVGGGASLRQAAIYVCFMFIYFMIVSLITTKKWLSRLVAALLASGVLTALYGLYQKLSGNMETGTMDKELFGDLGGRITSTFENSNMLGVFLIMVIPFALSYVFRPGGAWQKLLAATACAVMGICLIYTWSRGAWLGLIISLFVFVLLYSPYVLPILVPAGLLGVTAIWDRIGGNSFIENFIGRFTSILTMSDSSSIYRLGIWRGSMKVVEEHWLTGIGIGSEAFRTVYIRFAESGIETAVHSHNLFLQIIIEVGALGLAVFLIAELLCFKGGLELIKKSNADMAEEKSVCVAAISGLLAALIQGMTDFIWFNYRIFFFFWVVTAILSAASRIGRKRRMTYSEY